MLRAMKIMGPQDFENAIAIRPDIGLVDTFRAFESDQDHIWLASLPIAAAIMQITRDGSKIVATNAPFSKIALDGNKEPGLDLAMLTDFVEALSRSGRDCDFQCWESPDPVHPRELELNAARLSKNSELFLLSIVDRTQESLSQSNLRREMLTDSLTGFCNRVGFEEEVEAAVKSMQENPASCAFAIILIDLARFSRVNESVGSLAGDELIITVARRIKARIRSSEVLGRLSGNEFALFVPLQRVSARHDQDQPQADDFTARLHAIVDRLNASFVEPCFLSNLEIQVECALAADVGNAVNDDPMDILRNAQIAMKRAKLTKAFELYVPGSIDTARRRFSIETDLRRALQNDELTMAYQPLIDLETGQLSGFEALARWDHPDHGAISPVDFIPVAEESGLIVPLGRWALHEAARTIRTWDNCAGRQLPIKVSVNLSVVQLMRDNVVSAVAEALNEAGIGGNRLTLEITESAFVTDPDGAIRTLNALKALDANLAMDDFGTGYSNLAYLQKLPIDVLKIDRSFVSGLMEDKDKRAIVKTVLSLAHALGMQTTAEGIETIEISSVLKQLGCSFGQGYYFARPLTQSDAYNYLLADNAPAIS
jgi:diguanylate cyclase (GGDEF)-like protein